MGTGTELDDKNLQRTQHSRVGRILLDNGILQVFKRVVMLSCLFRVLGPFVMVTIMKLETL